MLPRGRPKAAHSPLANAGLPGARYVAHPSMDVRTGRPCSLEALQMARDARRAARGRAPLCQSMVGIGVPRAHYSGFHALLKQLKRRALRGESPSIVWTA